MSADAVTHRIKSVRHHHIELSIPAPPPEDEEAFVVTAPVMRSLGELRVRPQDFNLLIACLQDARDRIMGTS